MTGGTRKGLLCGKIVGSSMSDRQMPRQKDGTVRGMKNEADVVQGHSAQLIEFTSENLCSLLL